MTNKVECIIVCGPPGAGKSTYVASVMEKGDLILDVDALFRALSGFDDRTKPEGLLIYVLAVRDAIIDNLAKGLLGPSKAYIIMGGENNEARHEIATRLNAKVLVIPTPYGECIRRMTDQGRSKDHIDEVSKVCERWHSVFHLSKGETVLPFGRGTGLDGWPVT